MPEIHSPPAFTPLTDERSEWRRHLELGGLLDIYVLQQYRLNRDSDLWRSTREVEKLCEYILFLEGANVMSESISVHCDQCHSDISSGNPDHPYRLRLIEEARAGVQANGNNELQSAMNFCSLAHLKHWLEQDKA